MSFAHYFRVKADLYRMMADNAENNAIDRAWYSGLVRSYALLAASEDRHYHTGLRTVSMAKPEPAPDLEAEIAQLMKHYGVEPEAPNGKIRNRA